VTVESVGRRGLGEEAPMEEPGRVEIEVDDTDDPTNIKTTKTLPPTQL